MAHAITIWYNGEGIGLRLYREGRGRHNRPITMRMFSGFPSGRVRVVGLPEPVFTELIPQIDDLAELKVSLHVLWRLGRQEGKVSFVRHEELLADQVLLGGLGERPGDALTAALSRAIGRGTLLVAGEGADSPGERLYFANSPKGRAAVEALKQGEWPQELEAATRPNVFTLYEQNVGVLTPLIADELREAEETYPADWIEEAFRESVSLNKRSWRYIRAILDRWRVEGKGDRADGDDSGSRRRRYL